MKKNRKKEKIKLQPIMSYVILILAVIGVSGLLSLLDIQATYYSISNVTLEFSPTTEVINSLLNLSGLKYIFENTVANFANFTVLSNLIIILIGFSIMEKSGFLKTAITILTKKAKKTTVTFIFSLLCIISSIMGDLSYLIFIPIGALLFLYGKRNPATGIICAFASLACGSSISLLLTSTDSSVLNFTKLAASTIDANITISNFAFVLIMLFAVIISASVITYITEVVTVKKVPKFDFDQTIEDDDIIITTKRKKGMLFALFAATIYLIFFIYNIIPGLPLSGNLLDNSQVLYIDKLFSPDSFFSSGFVFIVTVLFVILGLFYGIGAKTINNHREFCNYLSHSLDGIGNMLVMILFASTLISIFKQSNIGNVIVAWFSDIIGNSGFTGIPLILLLFLLSALATFVLPNSTMKWTILSSSTVTSMMSSGISPEFAQVVFRFGEAVTMNLTPLLAYFIVYLAYLEKYNQEENKIHFSESIKYQMPYSFAICFSLIAIILLWFIVGIPLGVDALPSL